MAQRLNLLAKINIKEGRSFMSRKHEANGDQTGQILSVSYVANRVISKKLDPKRHPIKGDTVPRLLVDGLSAASGRFDVAVAKRLGFASWFLAAILSPEPIVQLLAEQFFFPQK